MDVTNNHDRYDSALIDPIMPLAIAGLLLPKFLEPAIANVFLTSLIRPYADGEIGYCSETHGELNLQIQPALARISASILIHKPASIRNTYYSLLLRIPHW